MRLFERGQCSKRIVWTLEGFENKRNLRVGRFSSGVEDPKISCLVDALPCFSVFDKSHTYLILIFANSSTSIVFLTSADIT